MEKDCDRHIQLLTFKAWENQPVLVHGFGNRLWREHCFSSDPELRSFNRILLRQIHSDVIHVIHSSSSKRMEGDALITRKPGILLIIKTADCLPILLSDKANSLIAAAHCGWRGTAQKLIYQLVKQIQGEFSIPASSLSAVLGPCIGQSCYEVGPEVRREFLEAGLSSNPFHSQADAPDKFLLNLKSSNRDQMVNAGIPPSQIFSLGDCTHCNSNMISFRRDRSECGRMFSFVGLRAKSP